MRRIVPILALVVALGIGAYFLLRPKGGGTGSRKKSRSSTSDTNVSAAKTTGTQTRRAGKTTGRVRPRSKKELRAEKKARRKEERRRRREERRRQREQRRRLKEARSKRGRRKKSKRGQGQAYIVSAIVSLGSESYALVDGRRVSEGDVVMGRRIVSIRSDRVEVDAFGRRQSVRVGESMMPPTYSTKRRR